MGKNVIPFSIVFLGICIVLGSWLIAQSFSTQHAVIEETENEQLVIYKKQLLTKEEISAYLGITTQQVDELDKTQTAYVSKGIPFLISENAVYYTIQGIEKWLTDISNYHWYDLSDY